MKNTNTVNLRLVWIPALVAIIGFVAVACDNGNPDTTPTVTSVTVSPATPNVVKGTTQTFTATVTGTNSPAQTVTWSIVETNKNMGTTINTSGVLTVAAAETLASLTVKATSTVDTTKNGTATVTIYNNAESLTIVTNVMVNPDATTVAKGENQTFTATVTGTNSPAQTVTWSIVETNKNMGTTINTSGVLTVAATETLTLLTVRATSTVDAAQSGTATVTITPPLQQFDNITASQLVAKIKIGWNLGNTLDATNGFGANPTVTQMETGWSNPVTTKEMITAIKDAGFNAIRIPVSWTKAAGGAPNYTIRADWMARVVEVVNYAVDNDMYIILNTHHDEKVFTIMDSNVEAGKAAFQKIWDQIASTFRNYNEKLIFEGLNEPRTIGSPNEWNNGTPEERANLNSYYEVFVQTVRNSGGNNDKRMLMINTYAGSSINPAVNDLILPKDTAANKLIVSIHSYAPVSFCYPSNPDITEWSSSNSTNTNEIIYSILPAYNTFKSKGIPVIIGEFGAVNKNNTAAQVAWAEYFVSYAKSQGIPCFYWDNGVKEKVHEWDEACFGLFNRNTRTFYFPEIKDAIMKGVASSP